MNGTGYHGGQSQGQRRISEQDAKDAAAMLASLMERHMGLSRVDPIALRLFIRSYWSRVSTCAHTIHDQQD
jgi:hypothetical protein